MYPWTQKGKRTEILLQTAAVSAVAPAPPPLPEFDHDNPLRPFVKGQQVEWKIQANYGKLS